MSVHLLTSGSLASIQDSGRYSLMSLGISESGVMDYISYYIANILINAPLTSPVIEFRMLAPVLYFEEDCNIAVTGGDYSISIGNEKYTSYRAIKVHSGDTVYITPNKHGMYGYISFGSILDIPLVSGSFSTNVKCSIGGIEGRNLQKGDKIELKHKNFSSQNLISRNFYDISPSYESQGLRINKSFTNGSGYGVWDEIYSDCEANSVSDTDSIVTLHTVDSTQSDIFSVSDKEKFYSSTYTITDRCDRMGICLDGEKILPSSGCDIVSDAIVKGNIQITNSGLPLILVSDHQTTGGYTKIASVISSDIPYLTQLRPNKKVRFESITPKQAREYYIESIKKINKLRRDMIHPLFD